MSTAARTNDAVEIRWRGEVLEIGLVGYQSGLTITQMRDEIRAALGQRTPSFIFFDASTIRGFSPDVRGPGVEALRRIAESKVPSVAVVTHSPVRMMAMAIAFAAGLRLEMFATRAEAERRISAG